MGNSPRQGRRRQIAAVSSAESQYAVMMVPGASCAEDGAGETMGMRIGLLR